MPNIKKDIFTEYEKCLKIINLNKVSNNYKTYCNQIYKEYAMSSRK